MGKMKEIARLQAEEADMSGTHLHPSDMEDATANNAAVNIEGLTNWLRNLTIIDQDGLFLRVKDVESGTVYLIKQERPKGENNG